MQDFNEIVLEEKEEELPQAIFPPSLRNTLARVTCFSANLAETFFSVFLWQSVVDAAEKAIEMFGGTVSEATKNYIRGIAVPFAVANLISDLTSLDAMREADILTLPSEAQKKEEYVKLSKQMLGFFIKLLAATTSFPAGGSASALAVSTFVANVTEGLSGDVLRYGSFSLVAGLGVVFFILFTNSKIQRHSDEFIDTFENFSEFVRNFFSHPGKYLEVYIQSFSNACYRAVIFSYILQTVGQNIFYADKDNSFLRAFTITTGISTFFITLFSRFLSTRDKFLNPAFKTLTEAELKEAPRFRKTLIYDAILSLIRGGSVGALISEFIPLAPILKYGISSVVGLCVTTHSFYVRYQAGYYEEAFKLKQQNVIDITENKTESDNLLSIIDPVTQASALFDQIAASHNSSALDFSVNSINFTARLTRFLAFLLFIETFNQVFLNNGLSNVGIISLVFLWGAEVFKNDCDLFGESLRNTWQGFAAKWQLEKESGDTANCSCFSGSFFRPARVIFKSLYDYPLALIEKVAQQPKPEAGLQLIQ